ncbi:Dual specificity protein phosphatase 3 [Mactra antiquata]
MGDTTCTRLYKGIFLIFDNLENSVIDCDNNFREDGARYDRYFDLIWNFIKVTMGTKTTVKDVKDYLASKAKRGEKNEQVWLSLTQSLTNQYNEVYPNVILGDSTIAKKPRDLKELGVTHVLNCACGSGFNQVNTTEVLYAPHRIKFHGIPAKDIRQFSLYEYFNEAASFIDDAVNNEGKIYVHCVAGVSRSATIVIAFLMLRRKLPLMDAVKIVREDRGILPNDGFLNELVRLNDELYGT